MIKQTLEESLAKKREYSKRLYRDNEEYRAKKIAKANKYYQEHKEAMLAQQKEYRQRKKQEKACMCKIV